MAFISKTFKLTILQVEWLKYFSEKTGLNQVEIIRRALDFFAESEEIKEDRRYFSPEQRAMIRKVAQMRGESEKQVVSSAVEKDMRHLVKRSR